MIAHLYLTRRSAVKADHSASRLAFNSIGLKPRAAFNVRYLDFFIFIYTCSLHEKRIYCDASHVIEFRLCHHCPVYL